MKNKKRKISVSLPKGEVAGKTSPAPIDHLHNKEFGTIRLTTIQLPEIVDWQIGQEYNLSLKVRQVETRERQETKWNDKTHEEEKIGEPYFESEFRIVNVTTNAPETEKSQKSPNISVKVAQKTPAKSENYEDNS